MGAQASLLLIVASLVSGFRAPPGRPALAGRAAATGALQPPRLMLEEIEEVNFETLGSAGGVDHGPVGVLLLSVGAPENPDDVEEYLYNVFCDPEIRTLPPALSWALKKPLAWFISKQRAAEARDSMVRAGGQSPQLSTIEAQARALQAELAERGVDARPYLGMRYWHPFAEEAVQQMKLENIQKLVIVPLYPQVSGRAGAGGRRADARRPRETPSRPPTRCGRPSPPTPTPPHPSAPPTRPPRPRAPSSRSRRRARPCACSSG